MGVGERYTREIEQVNIRNYKTILTVFIAVMGHGLMSHASPLDTLEGVQHPDVSLEGTWHFQLPAPEDFWKEQGAPTGWTPMPVPGDVFREGHAIKEDLPFAYKKKISIPADFSGKQIRLRFEGAHDFTRVWVNGQFIRDHQGGWTPW